MCTSKYEELGISQISCAGQNLMLGLFGNLEHETITFLLFASVLIFTFIFAATLT